MPAQRLHDAAPEWGIRPVPDDLRRFGGLDLAILWGDLSIGLLVLFSGTLLVPALGLPTALLAILVGSIVGSLPLALVGLAGARERVPGMVLFRPLLGLRGSYLPSAMNLIQLVGWSAFEFWAMARVADSISSDLFGIDAYGLWLVLVAAGCTALAWSGPVFVVRRWLERFGAWIIAAVAAWISFRVLTVGDLAALWHRPGSGGLPFWLAVDLVIAMPISWLPLVADFTRFAKSERRAAAATFWSYAAGNAWFYALGAMLVLAAGSGSDVLDLGTTIAASAGGAVVLLALLAGESDQAMANVYSSAVSIQNVFPGASPRRLIVAVGAIGLAVAAMLKGSAAYTFETFLFLIGAIFVPLFGVFLADWLVLRRGRIGEAALFENARSGFNPRALIPWAAGFALYQWCVPTGPSWWVDAVTKVLHSWLHLPVPLVPGYAAGASIPAFAGAFLLSLVVLRRQAPAEGQ